MHFNFVLNSIGRVKYVLGGKKNSTNVGMLSSSIVSDSSRTCGLLCPWNFLGKKKKKKLESVAISYSRGSS